MKKTRDMLINLSRTYYKNNLVTKNYKEMKTTINGNDLGANASNISSIVIDTNNHILTILIAINLNTSIHKLTHICNYTFLNDLNIFSSDVNPFES